MSSELPSNEEQALISINSLLEYSVEAPQHKSSFRGLHKFLLRTIGKKFNPRPQPTFKISYSLNSNETTSLPPEIWTDIFHRICDEAIDELISWSTDEPGYHPPGLNSLNSKPIMLSRVCRYWHALITSNPRFWNRVFIHMRHTKPFSQQAIKHLQLWLARSAPLPVSLYFDALSYYNRNFITTGFSKPLINIIELIHMHAHRFDHLSLKLCSYGTYTWDATIKLGQKAKKPISLDFVSLESMDMIIKEDTVGRGDKMVKAQEVAAAICGNRERVSRLRFGSYLYIHGNEWFEFDRQIQIQPVTFMKNLTCLEFCYMTIVTPIPTFLSHMSHMRNLSELWLVGTGFEDSYDEVQWQISNTAPRKRTVLRSIEKLHLLVCTHSNCVPFLAGVSLPNLTTLDVDENSIREREARGHIVWRRSEWSDLLIMLSESKCILRNLNFKFKKSLGPVYPDWNFFQSETCSSLQELTIQPRKWNTQGVLYLLDRPHHTHRNSVTDKGLPNSVARLHKTPFVTPTLKRLTVLGCITEDEAIVRLASDWMEGENSCLEYLYVEVKELHPKKHPKAIQLFDDLYKRGKKAYLKKSSSRTAFQDSLRMARWINFIRNTPNRYQEHWYW